MLKTRKKWISILLTLAMLVGLMVPFAGPAAAATTNIVTATPTYTQNAGNQNLGQVWIYENDDQAQSVFTAGSTIDITVTILTSGVEFQAAPTAGTLGSFVTPLTTLAANNTIAAGDLTLLPGATTKTYTVRVTPSYPGGSTRGGLQFMFPVNISGASSGPIEVEISAPDTGITGGKFVVGNIAGTGTRAVALDTSTVQVGATNVACGLLRIEEAVVDSLAAGDVIRIDLPADITWNANTIGSISATGVTIGQDTDGNGTVDVTATITTSPSGFSRLNIPIFSNPAGGSRAIITIQPRIDVDDDAVAGDITLSISGNTANVTSESVVIGTVGEYGVKVEAIGDPKTVIAGGIDQELAPFRIIENVAGSLTNNRTVLIELPSYVRWWSSDPSVTREKGNGNLATTAGATSDDNRHIKKYTVTASTSASTFKFERVRVYVDADAPEGDITVKFSGTAGLTGELVLGKVVKPVSATGGDDKVIIGRANQKVSDITIKEGVKGAIAANPTVVTNATRAAVTTVANQAGWLVIDAPDGVTFAEKPTVEVTEGNIKLEKESVRLDANNNQVWIRVLNSSTIPSTIKLSNVKLTLDRTVPEGELKLDITGSAVDRVTNRSGASTNDTAVASAVVAECTTPAPSEQKATVVFKVSDTKFTVNGVEQTMDVAPYIKDGRTYIPVRYVAQALGVAPENILYADGKVTLIKGERIVQLTIGSNVMAINGISITMDVPAEIKDGRTMLPFRWVAEKALGAKVNWDEASQTVTMEL